VYSDQRHEPIPYRVTGMAGKHRCGFRLTRPVPDRSVFLNIRTVSQQRRFSLAPRPVAWPVLLPTAFSAVNASMLQTNSEFSVIEESSQ
jgi:hypothetical protein